MLPELCGMVGYEKEDTTLRRHAENYSSPKEGIKCKFVREKEDSFVIGYDA